MTFTLPKLPWAADALAPYISAETIDVHYGKHHRGYVDKLNKALADHDKRYDELEDVIRNESGNLFNLAAQCWNHAFYWRSLAPGGGGDAPQPIAAVLTEHFGSVNTFKTRFADCAAAEFGSGWAWLSITPQGALVVDSSTDAQNPMSVGQIPLLTLDVWEHAYYLDYKNERPKYIHAFLEHLLNWKLVATRLEYAKQKLGA